jgi:hypothetical protein
MKASVMVAVVFLTVSNYLANTEHESTFQEVDRQLCSARDVAALRGLSKRFCQEPSQNAAIKYGLCQSYFRLSLLSTKLVCADSYEAAASDLLKLAPGKASSYVAYAQYLHLNRDRCPQKPKPQMTAAVRVVDRGKEMLKPAGYARDAACDMLVGQLFERAYRLDPKNAYALLYKAKRCADSKSRMCLAKQALANGDELVSVECHRMIRDAAARLGLTPESKAAGQKFRNGVKALGCRAWSEFFVNRSISP